MLEPLPPPLLFSCRCRLALLLQGRKTKMKLSDLMVLPSPSPINNSGKVLLPLRWKGTRDQWWYASPIDLASALGHFDVVLELLSLDPNNLLDLTSLRRIHRLDSLWPSVDDDSVPKCRSRVAQELLLELDSRVERASMPNANVLVSSGYGGWLMYTAASAGDTAFVAELLDRNPLLVFGEGEYGLTDILYAGAKSQSDGVFRLLLDFAISPRFCAGELGEGFEERIGEAPVAYKREIRNRAVHAAARGGNSGILKELLADCSDMLDLRDVHGSTVLHSAAGKGHVKVVEDLIQVYPDILVNARDHHGDTALHIAAYKGQMSTLKFLISNHPSAVSKRNDSGDTLLHMAVTGLGRPGFRELDGGIKMLERLCSREFLDVEDTVNVRNNDGRTALHLAISGNLHPRFVEILTSVPSVDINLPDRNGMTPLDVLRKQPRSVSANVITRRLVEMGGVSGVHQISDRKVCSGEVRMSEDRSSPGTAFDVPDGKIFSYADVRNGS